MPGIDLHTHSNRSDGTFEPAELVHRAAALGLETIALTDHDTVDGLVEAVAAGGRAGVEVVPGIEFSAEFDGASVHVLCYWMDPQDAGLSLELARLRDDRSRRGEAIVGRLRALGMPVDFEQVRRIAGAATIVRPHIAQAMVEAGVVATEQEAFDRYLADGRPGHVAKHALDPVEAVALIRGAGGACVLAHPGMWTDEHEVPTGVIDAMAAAGLHGLEVDHPDHAPEQRARYRAVAERLGLVATGGSDCHGLRYEPVRLGSSLCDPDAFAELRRRVAR